MSKKTILVVEDDQYFREAICDVLKKKYNILEAPNGKVASEILSMSDLDLVLSDIQMPGLTGLELLEWSKKNKPVPFILQKFHYFVSGIMELNNVIGRIKLRSYGILYKRSKRASYS